MIKRMFSIEIESDLSQSLFLRKTQRPFVSQEIAEMFQCPEVNLHDCFGYHDCIINFFSLFSVNSLPLRKIFKDWWNREQNPEISYRNITLLAEASHPTQSDTNKSNSLNRSDLRSQKILLRVKISSKELTIWGNFDLTIKNYQYFSWNIIY